MLCLFFILGIFAIFRLIVKRNKTSTKVPITELPKTPGMPAVDDLLTYTVPPLWLRFTAANDFLHLGTVKSVNISPEVLHCSLTSSCVSSFPRAPYPDDRGAGGVQLLQAAAGAGQL